MRRSPEYRALVQTLPPAGSFAVRQGRNKRVGVTLPVPRPAQLIADRGYKNHRLERRFYLHFEFVALVCRHRHRSR